MRFRIHNRDYEISRDSIIAAVRGVSPNPSDQRNRHYVVIEEKHYPIKQVIHLATGLPNIAFTAQYAYRILRNLGFELLTLP